MHPLDSCLVHFMRSAKLTTNLADDALSVQSVKNCIHDPSEFGAWEALVALTLAAHWSLHVV